MVAGARRRGSVRDADRVVVVGLGRFGATVAGELRDAGYEVLAIDSDPDTVQRYSQEFAHIVNVDATDEGALRQLGLGPSDDVVVGIGSHLEASILTTAALLDVGVRSILAKAVSEQHGRILERVGATRVLFPEQEMGRRAARIVSGHVLEYLELSADFALALTAVPGDLADRPLGEPGPSRRHGVAVVAVRRADGTFVHRGDEVVPHREDRVLVCGPVDRVLDFAHSAPPVSA